MAEHKVFRFISVAIGLWLMFNMINDFGKEKPAFTVDAELFIAALFVFGVPYFLGYFSRRGKDE